MGYYLFTGPEGMEGWIDLVGWDWRLNHWAMSLTNRSLLTADLI